jgi:DnaJ family protein C protein 8
MAEPVKDYDKLVAEEGRDDEAILNDLEKESREFVKVNGILHSHIMSIQCWRGSPQDSEIERILGAFRANHYDVLDLSAGVPDDDIKRTYRKKSLLIHPDKTSNPRAPDAFDRLAQAYQALLDEKKRAILDEAITDARHLLIRERKLTIDSEEVKDPDREFVRAWKEKVKVVLVDNEQRRRRQMKAQMQEEGREQRKADEELAERKRKRGWLGED